MSKILVLYSSPIQPKNSISTLLTKKFVELYKTNHQNEEIIELDLNDLEMATTCQTSKNMPETYSEELSNKYINLLKEADKLIISCPMINFNVPAVLKNFLDRIAVANKTFSYKYSTKGGSVGLLDNLVIKIIATQGAPDGWYQWASHTSFLKGIWNFFGAKVSPTILISGTKIKPYIDMTAAEIVEENIGLLKQHIDEF
ncbi:FMN-dependent NADH-azoreductase [Mycoplasma enhydrae]|uniref:FMN-dependent NADH-azoreductase n=1 Tax=Mycoplasma enhydrae TaxID=2499220 RepID=UPI00197C05A1|nr:FMN-dependent NADH-azoreductase [Mycoplasma enhydrae]MBN4089673.1 FMN-dependent NADH-azoreductase [Mycoplasma enhydrae]MCV3733918.1 FMN-dependent NADH-azoreductase [Mycoplasma enhydrae]MCV3753693.1 FMN-dependent NADH-azoreductase [Mycoplasma enhydrae]